MGDYLDIVYCLEEYTNSDSVDAFLRHCFDDLDCSRSGPDGEGSDLFSYSSLETDWERVSGDDVDIEEAISSITSSERGTVWLWYDDLNVGIHINRPNHDRPDIPSLSLSINEWYTKPWWDNQPSLIYEFVLELYDYLSPVYVYGNTYLDESSLTRQGITNGQLEDLFWVNGFGPEMAQQIGRDHLLEAPAWRVDDCDDGGVFLWVSPLPYSESRNENMTELQSYFDL